MTYLIVFVLGAVIGSFLNVCIYRVPTGRSIILPRSFCPFCEKSISWYDNVPLISFLVLGGRCRSCGKKITLRYFLVELITGFAGVMLLYFFPAPGRFLVYWFLTCVLITVTVIDIERREIPDVISIPCMIAGVIMITWLRPEGSYLRSFGWSVLGVLAGGGSMFLMSYIGELIFKKETLGGGDIKLMAMIGAFLGWKLVLLTFFMAPVLGSGVSIFMKIKRKNRMIAYGPYLASGALICLLYGDRILKYLFGA